MRLAALYDIHGNLPALEAVLDEVARLGVDEIVVGGDIFPGPMAREALAHLRSLHLAVQFIRGNCDRNVLEQRAGAESPDVPESILPVFEWSAKQLTADEAGFVSMWPLSTRKDASGIGSVLFCHATPRSDNEAVTKQTPDERVRPMFAGVDASLVVCGHTHTQFDRTIDGLRVINAGSVGMPFGERGAFWLLLDGGVHLRRTAYDSAAAAERIRRSMYPRAEEFVSSYIL